MSLSSQLFPSVPVCQGGLGLAQKSRHADDFEIPDWVDEQDRQRRPWAWKQQPGEAEAEVERAVVGRAEAEGGEVEREVRLRLRLGLWVQAERGG